MPAPTTRRRSLLLLPLAVLVFGLLAWRSRESNGLNRRLEALRARGEPTSAAELAASLTNPPPDQNGAPLLLDAAKRLNPTAVDRHLSKPLAAWSTAEVEWATAYSKDPVQAETLELLQKACRKPVFQFTTATDLLNLLKMGAPPYHDREVHDVIRFLVFRARAAASQGQTQQAYAHLLDALRLISAFDADTLPIAGLSRTLLVDLSIETLGETLGKAAPPAETLQALERACLDAASPKGLQGALRLNRVMTLEHQAASATTAEGDPGKKLRAIVYGLAGGRASDLAFQLDTFAELDEILNRSGAARIRGVRDLRTRFVANSRGWNRAHSRFVIPPYLGFAEDLVRTEARTECTRAALAIERYRAAHQGTLPDSLTQLVPDILPTVPLDPMDDQPLRYRRLDRGYTVYSIGLNDTDDAGAAPNPNNPAFTGDISITVTR